MAEELSDFFYRIRGELEQAADLLIAPCARLEELGEDQETVDKVRVRISKVADEIFERYLDELSRCNCARRSAARAPGEEATDRG